MHEHNLIYPAIVKPDTGLEFMDVDPCSSDSDLEDVVRPPNPKS